MPLSNDEIVALSAVDLSTAIAAGGCSCVAVMTAVLERIDARNPALNAIVALRPADDLLAEAAAADATLRAGARKGWLHGIPYAVKDMEEVAGLPWTAGSLVFKDRIGTTDAAFVRRLRQAGAIIIGKTNTPEFGYGSQTYNAVWGTTRNPYDRTRTAGGSSGGAAAAVAARLLPIADGGDFMGSLRNPPAFTNVLGLRPTQGLIAAPGLPGSLSTLGPIARSTADLAALLNTMAGRSDAAVVAPPDPTGDPVRIAWTSDLDGRLALQPAVRRLLAVGRDAVDELGWTTEDFPEHFDWESLWQAFLTLRAWFTLERRAIARDPVAAALVKPEARWEFARSFALTGPALAEAFVVRARWEETLDRVFQRFDAIAAPTTQVMPFAADLHWPTEIDGVAMDTYHRWMEVVVPWTMSGRPAVNIPLGFDADGLPTGLTLVGRPFGESRLLGIAERLVAATGWLKRAPP
jgi:amidase